MLKIRLRTDTLNRHILDPAWSKFLSLLACKALKELIGGVVRVKATNTSKRCAKCGYVAEIKLSDRWFVCPKCRWGGG